MHRNGAIMKLLVRFVKLPVKQKLLFGEAFIVLGTSRFIIWKLKFKQLAHLLGKVNQETVESEEGIDSEQVQLIGATIKILSRYTPWKSNCLVQAYAGKRMLTRRKLGCTIYLGVAKDHDGTMIAHAWLRCGTTYVTGGNGSLRYTITNKFASGNNFFFKSGSTSSA